MKSIILLLMLIPTKNLSSDVAAYAGSYTKADISADVLSSMFRLKRYRCYRDGADINERSHKPTSGASKSATRIAPSNTSGLGGNALSIRRRYQSVRVWPTCIC